MADSLIDALRERLLHYDGRAVTLLGEVETTFSKQAGYLDALITLTGEPAGHIADGATWLLKSAFEADRTISETQSNSLCRTLEHVHAWPAQLHLCQTVRHWPISRSGAALLADWLAPLLIHERPFLRAWSLDAMASVASSHSDYEGRFRKALAAAEQDDAASVRARARKVRAAS